MTGQVVSYFINYEGGPKNPEFTYKTLCIYSYMFILQSPSRYSPFDWIHLSRCFFQCSKHFLNSFILMPFSDSSIFCFTFSMSAKRFLLRTIFIWGNIKKHSGQNQVKGEWGMGVMQSLVKNWWTVSAAGAGAFNVLKVFQKHSLKQLIASQNTTSWYTNTDAS